MSGLVWWSHSSFTTLHISTAGSTEAALGIKSHLLHHINISSFFCLYILLPTNITSSSLPVHTGVCSVIVEGTQRTDATFLTLLVTVLRDREGGATALAGGHTGAVLHVGRTGDSCRARQSSAKTQTHSQFGLLMGINLMMASLYSSSSYQI